MEEDSREAVLRGDLVKLGGVTVLAESITRLLPYMASRQLDWQVISVIVIQVVVELAAQHFATLCLAMAALWVRGWYPTSRRASLDHDRQTKSIDGRQHNFLYVP